MNNKEQEWEKGFDNKFGAFFTGYHTTLSQLGNTKDIGRLEEALKNFIHSLLATQKQSFIEMVDGLMVVEATVRLEDWEDIEKEIQIRNKTLSDIKNKLDTL